VFEDAIVEAKAKGPRPEVFEAEAKARSFRIKATYAYEFLHD